VHTRFVQKCQAFTRSLPYSTLNSYFLNSVPVLINSHLFLNHQSFNSHSCEETLLPNVVYLCVVDKSPLQIAAEKEWKSMHSEVA